MWHAAAVVCWVLSVTASVGGVITGGVWHVAAIMELISGLVTIEYFTRMNSC